ncbi:MAG: hypothetical protein RLZZ175_1876 [Bacteroidota bacterium]|jgi:LAO/AO transport system kinase
MTLKRLRYNKDEILSGILQNDRAILAYAITLAESKIEYHQEIIKEIINVLPQNNSSFRLGLTGVPGAGKSSVINRLGCLLVEKGFKIAVVTIDPSSQLNHGSILADKTRMADLLNYKDVYVRPSSSNESITNSLPEVMNILEACGYNFIIIETVGVGQAEFEIALITDMLMYVHLPNAGDEMQGIKKGLLEWIDIFVLNKIDQIEESRIEEIFHDFAQIRNFSINENTEMQCFGVSSRENIGFGKLANYLKNEFNEAINNKTGLQELRNKKSTFRLELLIEQKLKNWLYSHPMYKNEVSKLSLDITNGKINLNDAVNELFNKIIPQ